MMQQYFKSIKIFYEKESNFVSWDIYISAYSSNNVPKKNPDEIKSPSISIMKVNESYFWLLRISSTLDWDKTNGSEFSIDRNGRKIFEINCRSPRHNLVNISTILFLSAGWETQIKTILNTDNVISF